MQTGGEGAGCAMGMCLDVQHREGLSLVVRLRSVGANVRFAHCRQVEQVFAPSEVPQQLWN